MRRSFALVSLSLILIFGGACAPADNSGLSGADTGQIWQHCDAVCFDRYPRTFRGTGEMLGDDTCQCSHPCHNADEKCIVRSGVKIECDCKVCTCFDCEESRFGGIKIPPIDPDNPPRRQWATSHTG